MKKLGTLILGAILTLGIGASISFKPNTDVAHAATEATIAVKANTGTLASDKSSISWTDGVVTFTNFKAGSSTAIRTSDADHYRIYQNSNIQIDCASGNLTKIVFTCTSSSYATVLKNSIGDGATATSSTVTWTTDGTASSYLVEKVTAQTRINKIVATYAAASTKEAVGISATKVSPDKTWYVGDTIANNDINVFTIDEDGGNISKLDPSAYEISESEIKSTNHTITITYLENTKFKTTLDFEAKVVETSDFELVDDASDLVLNSRVIIAAADYERAMSTEQKTNNRGQAEIKKVENSIVEPNENVQIFTLEEGTVEDTYSFNTGSGYIYAASSEKNYLRTQNSNDGNSSFEIKISEGATSIIAKGDNTINVLQYNSESSLFSCYSAASQKPVCLYVAKPEVGKVSTIELNETKVLTTLDQKLTLIATVNEDATNKTLAWTSSDDTIATVADGKITFIKAGYVTITATSTDGSDISASCVVAITSKDGLTSENALTAEDAVVVAKYTGTTNTASTYFVTGKVTKIDTAFSTQYNNITFTIDNVFKAYRLSTTSSLDVVVGDYVVANGNIVNYNNDTPEFAAGCKLTSVLYTAASVAARIKTMADGWDNGVTTENCYNNYTAANELVLALSAEEKEIFKTSTDTEIANARTTYEHWCFVNGAETYEETVPAGSRLSAFNNSNNIIIIVVAISSLVILATAGLLISKKRRYSK